MTFNKKYILLEFKDTLTWKTYSLKRSHSYFIKSFQILINNGIEPPI